jgi:solute carrier family 25 S-adenosylmethionine transporter 26
LTETALIIAISAGSAGFVAAVITTPVNVAKTRIMLSAAGDDAGADAMRKVEKARGKGQSVSSLASEIVSRGRVDLR